MIGLYLSVLGSAEERRLFEDMYFTYRSMMYNTAYRILGNRTLSEDAGHNAFLNLAGNIENISSMDSDRRCSYLAISAKNAALKIYNKNKRENDIGDAEEDIPDISDLETDIENRDSQRRLLEIIMSFDEKYSDVLIMKYYHGMKDREIAFKLGISLENVKIRLVRGKNKLKKKLMEENYYDRSEI